MTKIATLVTPAVRKITSGKVRELYEFPGYIFQTSNRLSVYDTVVCEDVFLKGPMLNCISQANKELLEKNGIKTDFLEAPTCLFEAAGFETPDFGCLSYNRKLDMIPAEIIVRNVMTGSLWEAYRKGEKYCGITLPEGLKEGSLLPTPIITPTTKATSGHDRPIFKEELIVLVIGWLLTNYDLDLPEEVEDEFNRISDVLFDDEIVTGAFLNTDDVLFGTQTIDNYREQIEFARAHNLAVQIVEDIYSICFKAFNVLSKKFRKDGILLVDTKFELGLDDKNNLVLGDEIGTPDSSRFVALEDYAKGQFVNLDKQVARDYYKKLGFSGDKGQKIPQLPESVSERLTQIYVNLAITLCGAKTVRKYIPQLSNP